MTGKHRGGGDTARRLGRRGITLHVSPEEHAGLQAAAAAASLTLKEFCRLASLETAGIEAAHRPDLRGNPRGQRLAE